MWYQIKIKRFLFLFFLLGFTIAKSGSAQEVLQIQSDSLVVDNILQKSTHTGNVIVQHGTHTLLAEQLILYKNPTDISDIEKMIATGTPATFQVQNTTESFPLFGQADTLYYYPVNQKLILIDNAKLEYNQDIFTAPKITYDIQKNHIFSEKTAVGRPTIIMNAANKLPQGSNNQ